jgi:hypothetical protein
MWRRDRPRSAPKRYARVAGAIGPTVAWLLPVPHGTNHWAVVSLVAVLFVVPPLLVEAWWKRQSRRRAERLLIVPEGEQQRLLTGDGA